ncbi:uncharacterized protein LOC128993175 [Macrosteles quadrilineatus]|uniref:uncharacterized protein LOC128993175 n=1 Tax=Macrosteles quadrilineatus TaxID=74068 RepID=UPI0023E12D40|nr:uncharacterized protein LOC128993175 [Macrosteles quadrilineatus]
MIAQFVQDNHRTWDALIAEFQYAMNTAVHDSTGFSPAKLCFGRDLRLPRAIGSSLTTGPKPGDDRERTVDEVFSDREQAFKRLYDSCRQNLRRAFQRQSKYYNLRRREVQYHRGDQVMRRLHVLSSAAEAIVGKLAPKFQGPCTVVKRVAPNMYEVKDEGRRETHVVHVKDLKTYHERTDA